MYRRTAGESSPALPFHPAAAIFELLDESGPEFQKLVESVKERDLRVPIILHPDGSILDGRNRYRACIKAGVEPRFETWDGVGLAADFVWDLNFSRRHLDGGAKVMAAARYAKEREVEADARKKANLRNVGSTSSIEDIDDFGRSTAKAAEKFNLGQSTRRARTESREGRRRRTEGRRR
jgi:hypothetical protein